MDRFKFTEANVKKAIVFKKTGKGKPSTWVAKYKDDLTTKGSKLFYKKRQVVPREKVDDVLRTELYKKNGDIPSGRDSAFHILKQRFVGISRRAVMEFIRAQKPLGEIKAALNQPKQKSGEKLKNYIFETDLVFLKKTDLENANRKFIRDDIPDLSYILSTVEKVTGLCRFEYVLTKEASVVTPKVLKQCKEMARMLKTSTDKCDLRCDKGGEFNIQELSKHFKIAKNVSTGVAVENKNSQFQTNFFKIIRQRKANTIDDAMKQSEKLLNNTYNRIHKKTSNELVERGDEKENIKEYNAKRKSFIAGDKRKPFEAGQYVRLLVKDKKPGIGYKKYKNKTYSQAVYIIKKTTKKAVPRKYYVKGKWYLQSDLLKSAPRDEKSIELVKERDDEFNKKRKKEREEHAMHRAKMIAEEEKLKKKNAKLDNQRPSRKAGASAKYMMVVKKLREGSLDDKLDEIDEKMDEVVTKKEKAELQASKKKILKKMDDVLAKEEKVQLQKIVKKKKKSKGPKKTPLHKALIRYLKAKKLPTGGTVSVLEQRIKRYKQSLKKTIKSV